MPGWGTPTPLTPDSGSPGRISRFSGAERALHWLLATTFFAMLATGLALFVPDLAVVVPRTTAKTWHLDAALVLAAGVLALFVAHWPRLRTTMRDLDRFDRDDARWLLGMSRVWRRAPPPPQGRFNAGQKLNAALVGGLMVLMFVTGVLMLVGERDTRYRFAGTVLVHDWATWMLVALVAGHLYLALIHRSTRHALRGMVVGDVDRDWARRHHAKWAEEAGDPHVVETSPESSAQ